ncbi:MAG: cell division protein SepF [Firmicutes bacterium]|nr:cell division protein SepF [Bacillota bacterium]
MAATLMDRFLRFIGFEEIPLEEDVSVRPEMELVKGRKKGKVISLHNQTRMRVVVVEPISFKDAKRVVDHLKERQPVVLNLEDTEEELCQRIIDFVSGATFAADGGVQKVGEGIFLFTPNNVDIATEEGKHTLDDGRFPWVK